MLLFIWTMSSAVGANGSGKTNFFHGEYLILGTLFLSVDWWFFVGKKLTVKLPFWYLKCLSL